MLPWLAGDHAERTVMRFIKDWTKRRMYRRNTGQPPPDLQWLFLKMEHAFLQRGQPAQRGDRVVSRSGSDRICWPESGLHPFADICRSSNSNYTAQRENEYSSMQSDSSVPDVSRVTYTSPKPLDSDVPVFLGKFHRSRQRLTEDYIRVQDDGTAFPPYDVRPFDPHPITYDDSRFSFESNVASLPHPVIPGTSVQKPHHVRDHAPALVWPLGAVLIPGPIALNPELMIELNQPSLPVIPTRFPARHHFPASGHVNTYFDCSRGRPGLSRENRLNPEPSNKAAADDIPGHYL
ncbi:uncharacterized protein EI90DRAFT_1678333 [Cantharellus anzutake]|uniref:uncharacterized protein n=1 Tax=Cantharellus anzutake TaxID=1750568 RepID=UPI001904581E|nr:uncharacterized protein EI90DRAFT_1678333 [Cantharellus anzutake]KAF8327740.1 hypothetical protein EI90DRAFT_1678333 [Cantharellus anzutake]